MPKKATHPVEYFVAGGIAGVVSRTCIAPVERVKILYQISRSGAGTTAAELHWTEIAPQILRKEGVLAFWKGNTAAVVRVMPYMSCTFLTYEEYKASLMAAGVPKQASTLAAGSMGGVTAVLLTYPLDLVRATMATPGSTHTSMFQALTSIARERGAAALYAGCTATCIGVAPYAGLKFVSYEALKGLMGSMFGVHESNLQPWQRVCSGLVAGMLAQTFVYPLDVVRRRMQTSATRPYHGTYDALSTIARTEGVLNGLYRGLTLNCTCRITARMHAYTLLPPLVWSPHGPDDARPIADPDSCSRRRLEDDAERRHLYEPLRCAKRPLDLHVHVYVLLMIHLRSKRFGRTILRCRGPRCLSVISCAFYCVRHRLSSCSYATAGRFDRAERVDARTRPFLNPLSTHVHFSGQHQSCGACA